MQSVQTPIIPVVEELIRDGGLPIRLSRTGRLW
jgi:hypothetical protein